MTVMGLSSKSADPATGRPARDTGGARPAVLQNIKEHKLVIAAHAAPCGNFGPGPETADTDAVLWSI